jgi:adenylyltransferase/sulfurtransferase
MSFRTVKLRRDPDCPACGTRTIQSLVEYTQLCGLPSHADDADVPAIEPAELEQRLRRGDLVDLVDVREPNEFEIGRIDGARLAPVDRLAELLSTIDLERDVVVYCKVGTRSARAVRQIRAAGFTRVWNLAGGIDRWSAEIDPTVPRY